LPAVAGGSVASATPLVMSGDEAKQRSSSSSSQPQGSAPDTADDRW
jgi:hypothetical protein